MTREAGGTGPPGDKGAERLAQALAELAEVQLELEAERHRGAETEARFDLVLRAMSDAVFLADARGQIVRVNDAAVELTGRGGDDLEGRTVSELFEDGFPGTPWAVLERSPEGRLAAFEARVSSAGREPVPVSVTGSLLRDPTGKVVGEVYAAQDLSEMRTLVHELEASEARWRLLAGLGDLLGREVDARESLDDVCQWLATSLGAGAAVVLTDGPAIGKVVAWPTFGAVPTELEALVGRPPDRGSALATALREHRTVHAETLRADFPLLGSSGAPGLVGSAAIVPLVARGSGLGAVIVHGPDPGQVSAAAASVIEVAASRIALALANTRLRDALTHFEAAEEAARFREELLAGVSHDMQTPLAVLLNSLQALEHGRTSTRRRARLYEGMTRQTANLHRLVQQFLDYSRVEAGRPVPLRPRVTDLRAVIAGVRAAVGGGSRIVIETPGELPPVVADPDRLDQVLVNLVSNAVKYSPPRSPVTIGAAAAGDAVEIWVADHGPGMTPADLAHLFEKFFRGSAAANVPGTGLGLYMTRVLVEAQGGRITATSRAGEGTRFTVLLPCPPAAEDGA